MKTCIIGATGHVAYVLAAAAGDKDIDLIGIAPGSEGETLDRLQEGCAHHGLPMPKAYTDYRVMLDDQGPEIVGIGPQYADNAPITVEALRRDINVFVEKPLAVTIEELEAVEQAYTDSHGDLSCMLALRYQPPFMAAWEAVRRGAIGEPRLLTAQKSYKCGPRPEFFKDRARYGGTIPWVGSHGIDLLQWFSGQSFRSVYATHTTRANRDNGTMEMTALCSFTFTNDVYGGCNIDYLRPAGADSHGDDRVRVAGTEGVIEVMREKAVLIDASGTRELDPAPERQIFIDFVDSLRGDTTCRISAEEAFSMTRACLLARESADSGQVVNFP